MTRCNEFYDKVEKDGNFCGMEAGEYQRLLKIRDLQANNLDLSKLPASSLIPLVAVKDDVLKKAVIQAIVKDINAGVKVTRVTVRKYILMLTETTDIEDTKDIKDTKDTSDTKDIEDTNDPEDADNALHLLALKVKRLGGKMHRDSAISGDVVHGVKDVAFNAVFYGGFTYDEVMDMVKRGVNLAKELDKTGGDSRGNIGPISFSVDVVKQYLEDKGFVYSYRQRRTTGKTWYNDHRGHKSLGECNITEIGEMTDELTTKYVKCSGFTSVDEWMAAVERVHKNSTDLYLYKVVKVSG